MPTIHHKQLDKIKRLYYKDGFSMQKIADHLSVNLNSVIYFMRKHDVKRRNLLEANRIVFEKRPLSFSIPKLLNKNQRDLKTIGVMLYWSEGAKLGHTVDFSNSDVEMIKLFLLFLRNVCGVDESRLRGYIYCHKNQNSKSLIRFWSGVTKIPKSQFTKPYVREDVTAGKKHPQRMPYGLVHVRYNDLKLLRQIKEWIEETKQTWVGSEAVKRTTL